MEHLNQQCPSLFAFFRLKLLVMQLWGPGYKGGVAQLLCWKYCGNPRGSSGVLVETALKTESRKRMKQIKSRNISLLNSYVPKKEESLTAELYR